MKWNQNFAYWNFTILNFEIRFLIAQKTRNMPSLFPLKDKSSYKSCIFQKLNCSCDNHYIAETKHNAEVTWHGMNIKIQLNVQSYQSQSQNCRWLKCFIPRRLDKNIFYRQFLELALILNGYVTLYRFFIQTFSTALKAATVMTLSCKYMLSKSWQSFLKILMKDESHFLKNFNDEGLQIY